MENKGLGLACYEPPKPTAAEIADYKHRKKVAALVEGALLEGCKLLYEVMKKDTDRLDIYDLSHITTTLAEAAKALPMLEGCTIAPYGYTEEMEAGEDAEG